MQYKKLHYAKSDTMQFEAMKNAIGENAPGSLDKYQEIKYNNSKQYEELKDYKFSVENGRISPLADFNTYQKKKQEIQDKIIGMTAPNGVKITAQRKHFVERVIGSVEQKRNGVSVDDIEKCIKQGKGLLPKLDSKCRCSYGFHLKGKCEISINSDGELIQVNPLKELKY